MLRNLKPKVKRFFRRNGRVKTAKVLALIKSQGRTQLWLAREVLEITPEYFNSIIHGRDDAKLNPQKVTALAEALGVSPSEITRLFGLPSTEVN